MSGLTPDAQNHLGTDHPFFPPLPRGGDTEVREEPQEEAGEGRWLSVTTNYKAIADAFEGDAANEILGGNAIRLLGLYGRPT